jgi:hypothetical protein
MIVQRFCASSENRTAVASLYRHRQTLQATLTRFFTYLSDIHGNYHAKG